MPKVLNKRYLDKDYLFEHKDCVYVGRPSKWGNRYTHSFEGTLAEVQVPTREDAVRAYERWILEQPQLLADLHELRGKDLVCWCAPKPCHGDVLLRLANNDE